MPKGIYKRKIRTVEHSAKISLANTGKKHSEETKRKISEFARQKRKPRSQETREKISNSLKGKPLYIRRGAGNPRWKGGVSSENTMIRNSLEYNLWRMSVYKRDNFTCIWFGEKRDLQADHILPFADYPALRLAIDNGRTLCSKCHKKRHSK